MKKATRDGQVSQPTVELVKFLPSKVLWKLLDAQECVEGASKVLGFMHSETVHDAGDYENVCSGLSGALFACAKLIDKELSTVHYVAVGDDSKSAGLEGHLRAEIATETEKRKKETGPVKR